MCNIISLFASASATARQSNLETADLSANWINSRYAGVDLATSQRDIFARSHVLRVVQSSMDIIAIPAAAPCLGYSPRDKFPSFPSFLIATHISALFVCISVSRSYYFARRIRVHARLREIRRCAAQRDNKNARSTSSRQQWLTAFPEIMHDIYRLRRDSRENIRRANVTNDARDQCEFSHAPPRSRPALSY